ncbi:MAG: protein-disulfide reductase DsbD family protein [Ignavibacteriales bacterium]|nr:protein-disulfide reductase DsbD family protein [Ignavibacteriales bacterium]
MTRFFSIILLIAALAVNSRAGSSADVVRPEIKLSTAKIASGGSKKVAVLLHIADGWHINAHTPSADYLIGTSLSLASQTGVMLSDVRYPAGSDVKLAFADQPLSVYQGTVVVFLTLKFADNIAGADTVRASVEVQACNNQVCLPPSTIALAIPYAVAGAGEITQETNVDLFVKYQSGTVQSGRTSGGDIGALFTEKGSAIAFLAIFLIGLALNLTPCVYPMMSITVSLFGGQKEKKAIRVFLKAVTYVLGIATMYSVLGVTAALGGGLFGSWLQSSWVLAGIGVLLFGMALSSFGLYQIQMPYWLTSKLGGTTGTGIISLYLSGLVVGVFAAPCIGPPVIALLALVSAKADPVFGFWVFFALSMGLGFPYLVLGTFSGMIKSIPRSGTWLVWVERFFGVILVGAAFFYLSLAILPRFSAFVIPLTLLVGGVYLGFVESSGKESKVLTRIKWIVGTVAILAGLYLGNSLRQDGLTWERYSQVALDDARKSGTPVMMDFYADWCIPCLELEHQTFTDRRVIAEAGRFKRLKVDLTHFNSPEAEQLRKNFSIAGVPMIIFLDGKGEEASSARIVGFIPPSEFVERLKQVR